MSGHSNICVPLQVGMFLCLFLLCAAKAHQVQGEAKNRPYLDEAGNLCQDKVETVQDTEYETMIQCRVAMKKSCEQISDPNEEFTKPNEACHTMYEKKCKTVFRPHRSKVRHDFERSKMVLKFNFRVSQI